MPLSPDEKKALEEWRQRFLKVSEQLEAKTRGVPLLDTPPIGSYAEDFPELLDELLSNSNLDPTAEPWWGKED